MVRALYIQLLEETSGGGVSSHLEDILEADQATKVQTDPKVGFKEQEEQIPLVEMGILQPVYNATLIIIMLENAQRKDTMRVITILRKNSTKFTLTCLLDALTMRITID